MSSAVGSWALNGLLGTVAASDTVSVIYARPTGAATRYVEVVNPTFLASVWQAYEDSCYKYYADPATLAANATAVKDASFQPKKTFSARGPLSNYESIILDVWYPKSTRSVAGGARADYLSATSSLLSRVDSSLALIVPRTGVVRPADGGMASSDGGFSPSDVAIVKAWYFLDSNVPDVWKFGINNNGIFRYTNTQKLITK
jgi:hypothetical protein